MESQHRPPLCVSDLTASCSEKKIERQEERSCHNLHLHSKMALPRYSTTMENLPDEVLSDIFVRLLAKQLAQMRCVCKSWNALLSESSFVISHLHRSVHNNDEILLFFHGGFLFDYNSITARPTHSPDLELPNFIEVPVNLQSKDGYGRVIGSVNGLICFSYKPYRGDYVVGIWNPSLSAMLTLPPCSLPSNAGHHFRFGFDSKTDDYKIVKLTFLYGPMKILPEVEVYRMRKGSWEVITQRFPAHIRMIRDGDEVCVDGHDGCLHWLGYTDEEWKTKTIVAFDLGAETFCEIPLPDTTLDYSVRRWNVLGVLGGRLCVMSCVEGGECEVWVMDEYGVPQSWVKHHAFSQFSGDTYPYGFTSHNEFLFRVGDRFGLYDPVAAKTKTFKIKSVYKTVEYVDSLVWVAPAEHEL